MTYGSVGATLVVFWASYAEGDFVTLADVAALERTMQLQARYTSTSLKVVGVSCDVTKEKAAAFAAAAAAAELPLPALEADGGGGGATASAIIADGGIPSVRFTLMYDPAKAVRAAFQQLAGLAAVVPSDTFLIDGTGKVVWRERFGQMHRLAKGQLGDQVANILYGNPLVTNGASPALTPTSATAPARGGSGGGSGDGSGSDDTDSDMDVSDFDDDLGF
jgi:hypothetical protein